MIADTMENPARIDAIMRNVRVWHREQIELRKAMYKAGAEAVSNGKLAEVLGCSPGEASKRVSAHPELFRRQRVGREVEISLRRR
jgi:hypothetical protein